MSQSNANADHRAVTTGSSQALDWTLNDDAAATAQGWNLFDGDRFEAKNIQRIDAAVVFSSDAKAVAFVQKRAAAGDAHAIKALHLHGVGSQATAAAASVPSFSPEQIVYLRTLLTPQCCHATGMHDPDHFAKDPHRICALQQSAAYRAILTALGFESISAKSSPHCGWCGRAELRAVARAVFAEGDEVRIIAEDHVGCVGVVYSVHVDGPVALYRIVLTDDRGRHTVAYRNAQGIERVSSRVGEAIEI